MPDANAKSKATRTPQGSGDPSSTWLWVSRGLRILALTVLAFLTFWGTWQAHDSDAGPSLLQPSAPWTAGAAVGIWMIALLSWYLARRGRARPVAVVVVASSAVIALLMSAVPLMRCTATAESAGMQDLILTPIWRSMIIFVGTTPDVYEAGSGPCPGGAPLAVQIARFLAMIAVFGTATALGVNLANRQLTRIRARWSSFQDVVVGLGDDALVVLQELVRWEVDPSTGNPNAQPQATRPKVLALFTEEQAGNEAQARALGVMTAPYDRERIGADGGIGHRLTHYLTRRGNVGVERVWVFDADPFTAVDIAESAFATLAAAASRNDQPPPKIWVALNDRQLADSIRVRWLARDATAAGDAPIRTPVCPAETTSMELIGRVAVQMKTDYELVLCGDSDMAESLLVELATRLWEEADLLAAWQKHCASAHQECQCARAHDLELQVPDLPNHTQDLLVGGRMPTRVRLLSPNANALLDQVRRSLPDALSRTLTGARAHDLDWRGLTSRTWPGEKTLPSAVIVADPISPDDSHLGQRLVSLTAAGSVVWLPSALPGRVYPQAARETVLPGHPIQEYAKNLFLAGHVPEDAWNRIARHQHERYRRVNYNPDKRATRLAWWGPGEDHLDDKFRVDNLASVRRTLAWFANNGFTWQRVTGGSLLAEPPLAQPPFGMTAEQWDQLLYAEFSRYTLAHAGALPADGALPEGERDYTTVTVVTILQTLQANGYEPVGPTQFGNR